MIDRVRDVLAEDNQLRSIVQGIVEGVQPSRVILFGSRARGDARPDSDYDLVVELPFERADYYVTYGRVSAALRHAKNGAATDILIRAPGEIERKRDDPGYMDWDIARHGIILYPPGENSEALRPTSNRVRERRPHESIKDWLERIDQDLRALEAILDAGESVAWGAAGFHAQQAAEKYLKILLVQAGVHPPKTHRMEELIGLVRSEGYDFPPFTDECQLLNPYAVSIRYPEQAPLPNESAGRETVAAAKRIIDAAKALIRD
jgi:HEPN domain-containing protein/predicted nucleotidyltransferase